MTTSHISMTETRRDYLLVAADAARRGVPVSPWLARHVADAFEQLAADHDRYVDVTRRVRSQVEVAS